MIDYVVSQILVNREVVRIEGKGLKAPLIVRSLFMGVSAPSHALYGLYPLSTNRWLMPGGLTVASIPRGASGN